jgi:signal peptidase II
MRINSLFVFIPAFIAVVLDQLSKYFVSGIGRGDNISFIKGFISLTKTYNTGAAFSIMSSFPYLLAVLSGMAVILILFYLFKKKFLLPVAHLSGWGLILGGTVGNLTDRLLYGHVIDFIKFDFIDFPIFNFADTAINIGAFLIIAVIITESAKSDNLEENDG